MIVKPAKGLTVLDPVTMRAIPREGITVPDTDMHWARMAADGDVRLVADPDPRAPEPTAQKKGATPASQEPGA